jgi:hypothetical protein
MLYGDAMIPNQGIFIVEIIPMWLVGCNSVFVWLVSPQMWQNDLKQVLNRKQSTENKLDCFGLNIRMTSLSSLFYANYK